MAQEMYAVLQRVKDSKGNYVVTLPVNTVEEVYVNLETGETLSDLLGLVVGEMNDNKATIVEDLASVLAALTGILDLNLSLNHIYRENFKNDNNLNILSGNFESGCIRAENNQKVDMSFKNPYTIANTPEKFKFSHVMKYIGSPELTCQITFNALDSSPKWFDCGAVFASGSYATVPKIENKEKDIPFAINIKLTGTCNETSTLEISDITVIQV